MGALYTLEAFPIPAIKTEEVPVPEGNCPLPPTMVRAILQECPVLVELPGDGHWQDTLTFTEPRQVKGYDSAAIAIKRPTPEHGRSVMLMGEGLDQPWQDEYGNTFRSISLKGNNFTQPRALRHPTAVDEVIAYGLQESKIIERVLKASAVMRKRGGSTEYVIGLAEPRSYLYPLAGPDTAAYVSLTRAEYTRRIAYNFWSTLPEEEKTEERLADINTKFDKMTFYVSMRATDSAYRLADIRNHKDARETFFAEYNAELPEGERLFDANEPKDLERYELIVAKKLAKNLALLHIDLKHGFLHPLNITARGGIVDMDSVSGESLGFGDAAVTAIDRLQDLTEAIRSLSLVGRFNNPRLLARRDTIIEAFVNEYVQATFEAQGYDGATETISDIITLMSSVNLERLEDGGVNMAVRSALSEAYMQTFVEAEPVRQGRVEAYEEFILAAESELIQWLNSPGADRLFEAAIEAGADNFRETWREILSQNDFLEEPEFAVQESSRHLAMVVGKQLMPHLSSIYRQMYDDSIYAKIPDVFNEASKDALINTFFTHNFPSAWNEYWPALWEKYKEPIMTLVKPVEPHQAQPFFGDLEYTGLDINADLYAPLSNLAEQVPYETIEKYVRGVIEYMATHAGPESVSVRYLELPESFTIKDVKSNGLTTIITDGELDEASGQDETADIGFLNDGSKPLSYVLLVHESAENGVEFSLYRPAESTEWRLF